MSDFVFQKMRHLSLFAAEKKGGRKGVGLVRLFLTILAVMLLMEAAVYLFIMPATQTATVYWSGLTHYSEEDMNNAIRPVLGKSWINFRAGEARALISSVAGVEDVQIAKRFPDKVYIHVEERVPVAMTFITERGETKFVQVDRNGVLFSVPVMQTQADRSVPLVSGIPVENIPEGMRVPSKYRGLLEQIAKIRELPQNYFAAISEIHVVPKEYGNYELVLYPIHRKIRVLTGRQLTEEALRYMIVAVDVVNMLAPDVEEIDMRYGSISYQEHR